MYSRIGQPEIVILTIISWNKKRKLDQEKSSAIFWKLTIKHFIFFKYKEWKLKIEQERGWRWSNR